MMPIPPKAMKMVKIIPMADGGAISRYPTVVIVMAVMYKEFRKLHPSMIMYPEVPVHRITAKANKPLIIFAGLTADVLISGFMRGLMTKEGVSHPF
jgi:hypothetical protein